MACSSQSPSRPLIRTAIGGMCLFIIFIVAQSLLCGCSGSNDVLDSTEDMPSKYQVLIDLAIPDMGESGRATDYDDGRTHPFENFIDIDHTDYRFYAFDFDNKFIAPLKVEEIWALESEPTSLSTSSKKYQVLACFDEDPGSDFKIVVLANWDGYNGYYDVDTMTKGETTIEDLLVHETAEFTISDITVAPGADFNNDGKIDNLIPMFGVKEFENIEFTNTRVWLGDIHMLRAISKIEIFIDPAANPKIHINTLKLKNYYKKGIAMPALTNYLQEDYVNAAFAWEYRVPVTEPSRDADPEDLVLTSKVKDDKVTFFLPETRIIEDYNLMGVPFSYDDRTRLSVSFTMEGNSTFDSTYEYDIEFKFYDEQQATKAGAERYDFFDIRRNYFYRFAIKSISGANLTLYADVVPYTTVSLRPIFGFPQDETEIPDDDQPTCCGCQETTEGCNCSYPGCDCCTQNNTQN